MIRTAVLLTLSLAFGCQGTIASNSVQAKAEKDNDLSSFAPTSGVRRLSKAEIRSTISQATGYDPLADLHVLPEDTAPYDSLYEKQSASTALIEGLRALGSRVADQVSHDAAFESAFLPCTPNSDDDAACFHQTLDSLAHALLRRPLRSEEYQEFDRFLSYSKQEKDFKVAPLLAFRSMIQDPEFIYVIEKGQQNTSSFELTSNEIATRMALLLWGEGPDAELREAAATGKLVNGEEIRAQAKRMLKDERAFQRIAHFHALWLRYANMPFSAKENAMLRAESDALIRRVVFEEKRSWFDLFTEEESFMSPELAAHYEIPFEGEEAKWIKYPDQTRRGILSHGSVLSNGAKFGDTSPTLRGIFIREQLLCQIIPPPPPTVDADVDEPPESEDPNACKYERYKLHATGGCAGCHSQTDPIGFGLESYDTMGRFRKTEAGKPECAVTSDGAIEGVGDFSGPAELGSLLLNTKGMDACTVRHLYRFAFGREDRRQDEALIEELRSKFEDSAYRFDALLIELVSHPAFRKRTPE